jgi:hypothetical protein
MPSANYIEIESDPKFDADSQPTSQDGPSVPLSTLHSGFLFRFFTFHSDPDRPGPSTQSEHRAGK